MKCSATLLFLLIALSALIPLTKADVHYTANTYPFTFRTYSTAMGFDTDMTFTRAYRLSDYWYFTTATVTEIGFQVQVANLLVTDFFALDPDVLYFTVTAASGTSTTKIQVGTRGNATSVTGATSWSYDSGTHVLSIYVSHSSSIAVIVYWTAGGDVTPPTISKVSHNTTTETQPCLFSAEWQDDIALSGRIFSTNVTGSWVNETWTAFSTNPSWANETKTLPAASTVVGYRWYANDTSDNWATSSIYSLLTTALGESIVVLLSLPTDGVTKYANSVQFTYNPIFSTAIQNASLWLNTSGTWQRVMWNSSAVTNNTANSLTYSFTVSGAYLWNIGVYNTTAVVFGEFNRTITMSLEPRCLGTGYSTPAKGTDCTVHSLWDDGDGIAGFIAGTNITGTFANSSWTSAAGSPTEYLATLVVKLTYEVGIVVEFQFYANDTDDKWDASNLSTLTIIAAGGSAGPGTARLGFGLNDFFRRYQGAIFVFGFLLIICVYGLGFHGKRRRR